MAISLVAQQTFDHVAANNDTLTYTSTGGGSGSLMIAIVARAGGLATGAMTSVTDSASNTWSTAAVTRGAASGLVNTRIEVWCVYNYSAVTSITLNSGTSQYYATNLTEWSGMLTSDPADVMSPDNSAAASSTAIATPGITTTNSGDLVIAGIHYTVDTETFDTAGSVPTTGWTQLTDFDSTTVASARAAYQVMTATGTYNAAWTLNAAHAAGVVTVSFKPAAVAAVPLNRPVLFGTVW